MVGDWWLVGLGGWRLVVGDDWCLAVGGGGRLAVGGPRGRSLRAILSKKEMGSLKSALTLEPMAPWPFLAKSGKAGSL